MCILYFLTALIFCECRNCDEEEKRMVGSVVINRIRSENYPNNIYGVISQPGEFDKPCQGNFVADPSCISAAAYVLMHGPINDCVLFFQLKHIKPWSKKMRLVSSMKHHNFYAYDY